MKHIRVAVVGQPNTGKSSLINRLTDANLAVGNFPGITVDKQEITCIYDHVLWTFIDLPGTYALSAFSEDESITTAFILRQQNDFDIIISACDACQLEKNLQLTLEIATEIHKPIAVAISMFDEAVKDNISINIKSLTTAFGIPFLLHDIRSRNVKQPMLKAIEQVYDKSVAGKIPVHKKNITMLTGPVERNLFIHNSVNKAVKREKRSTKLNWTSIIDKVLLHPILGVPSLLAIMFSIFFTTFSASEYPSMIIESGGIALSQFLNKVLPHNLFLMAISDGVVPSIFVVLSFLPKILIIFIGIFLLERSGYMARMVFIADGILRKLGAEGKTIVPLITGMSCSVPAYMATRILSDKKSRIVAMFAIGMIPCSAKTILFILLTSAFFSTTMAPFVMMIIYISGTILGLASAALVARLMKDVGVKDNLFAFEMPKYRLPELKMLCSYLYLQIKSYLKSAALLISLLSFLLWALSHIPAKISTYKEYIHAIEMAKSADVEPLARKEYQEYILTNSVIGYIGRGMTPIFTPLGFDWKMNISLLAAITAKEVAISALGILYQSDAEANDGQVLSQKIREVIPFSSGISYIIFTLIYLPCISATAVFAKEAGKTKYVFYLVAFTSILAWLASFVGYRICLLLT